MSICYSTSFFYGFCASYEAMTNLCLSSSKFRNEFEVKDKEGIETDMITDWIKYRYHLDCELSGNFWSGGDHLHFTVSVGEKFSVGEANWTVFDLSETRKLDKNSVGRLKRLAKKLNVSCGFCLSSTVS